MKLLSRVGTVFDRINEGMGWFISALILFAMLAVTSDVTMRYLMNRPLVWADEITEYILIYLTFLGAAWVLASEGHTRIAIVLDRLKPRRQALLNTITSVIGAIVCLVLAWYSGHNTWDLYLSGYYMVTTLELPLFHLHGAIALGSFLLVIQFVRRAHFYKQSWRSS